jgi:hypothetical protein
MRSTVKSDFGPLKVLTEDLEKNRQARVKVGILGGKAGRKKGPLNNPTLGMIHEFGLAERNIPARSFLRVPLASELPKKMLSIGRAVWSGIIRQEGMAKALGELGLQGRLVVVGAFDTGGYGRWQQWSKSYARRRELGSRRANRGRLLNFTGPIKPGSLLILTGQLRRSISFEVTGVK